MGMFEHSWGDGISVLRLSRELYAAIEAKDYQDGSQDADGGQDAVEHSTGGTSGGGGGVTADGGDAAAARGGKTAAGGGGVAAARVAWPHLLEWDVPPSVATAAIDGAAAYTERCAALRISCLRFERWGLGKLKTWEVSPDGAVQVAPRLLTTALLTMALLTMALLTVARCRSRPVLSRTTAPISTLTVTLPVPTPRIPISAPP